MANETPNTPGTPVANTGKHGSYETIAAFLQRSNTALTNAQAADTLPLLEKRGYTAADFTQKLADTTALRTLNEAQKSQYGGQHQSTDDYHVAQDTVHKTYMDDVQLARLLFKKNTAALDALGLRGDRAHSQSGYASQGLLFYNNALNSDDYIAALAKKGISKDDLQTGQAAFKNLQTLSAVQDKQTGTAEGSTDRRDAAYDSLHEWISEFYATAKIALKEQPDLLKGLGL